MATTVYFATNRALSGSATDYNSYSNDIVSPSRPQDITYATAFVDDANLTADTVGAITSIQEVSEGGFSGAARNDLSHPGRNLLVFIHGFANTFENAITRAAFNQQWFAGAAAPGANTSVVAFCWPSLGEVVNSPNLGSAYHRDQTFAGQSDIHLMSFFANLEPIIAAARADGRRCFLLAHSMGNYALGGAVESWFIHGNGNAKLFDLAILAAADERYDTFAFPFPGRLSGLTKLADRICTLYSANDMPLCISQILSGVKRLGQDGPHDRSNTGLFPPPIFPMIDCTSFDDYTPYDFMSSHQYYRRSPKARDAIAAQMSAT